jgi:hypothetical protein
MKRNRPLDPQSSGRAACCWFGCSSLSGKLVARAMITLSMC